MSLHQTNDAQRDALMPVNKRYPIQELLDACRYYVARTNRRITFEWALIRGETDTVETAQVRPPGRDVRRRLQARQLPLCAPTVPPFSSPPPPFLPLTPHTSILPPPPPQELGRLLRGLHCHINVIPLNPTGGFGGKPTPKAGVDEFIRVLGEYGVTATPRTRRGIDIDAGCGQLKAELLKRRRPDVVGGAGGSPVGGGEAGEVGGEAAGEAGAAGVMGESGEMGEMGDFVSLDVEVEREHVFSDIEAGDEVEK